MRPTRHALGTILYKVDTNINRTVKNASYIWETSLFIKSNTYDDMLILGML